MDENKRLGGPRTLLEAFAARVASHPDGEATLHRRGDAVVVTTWREWDERARGLASALVALGIAPGDRVALVASTRVEWAWIDTAILMAGAVTVPVFPAERADALQRIVRDAGARAAFVEDPAQLAKLVEAREELGELGLAVLIDDAGLGPEGDALRSDPGDGGAPWLLDWGAFVALGQGRVAGTREELARRAAAVGPGDLASVTYTPGTEHRKGVRLTHANYLAAASGLCEVLPIGPEDVQLLYLPLAHGFGRIALQSGVLAGMCTAFARRYRTVLEDAATYRPTFFCSIPRLFEKVQADIAAAEAGASLVHQLISTWALDDTGGWLGGLKRMLADKLVYSPLKAIFGGRVRFVISGAAPLAVDTGRFFEARGLPILEGYGMTETAGVTHINRLEDNRYGSVGAALPGIEVRLLDDGEVLLRGGQVAVGYWHAEDPAAAPAVPGIDAEAWLHTGDLGRLDEDGYLSVVGRKRDIILTATGAVVSPGPIAEAVRADPLISQVFICGDGRPFVSALITLDREALTKHGAEAGLEGDYESLTRHPAIFDYVERVVARVNATLPPHETIVKFAVLDSEMTPETGDLTPTLAVRRKVAEERHRALLDSFYSEQY